MEKNRYIHYGIVLTGIAFLSALILALGNDFTAATIEANAKKVVEAARIKVLPVAKTFSEEEGKEASGMKFIPGKDEAGNLVGYVVSASENGYAGAIDFVLGIDKEGKITGLDIVGSQETPGLGSKINNQDWKNLWVGRDSQYKFNKSVDAFAGATISPECTYNGIVKVLTAYEKEVK
ncbi:MAG: RnfABCDGE type electron transport complex subunit G [Fusobacteriaceae bacterium]|nr:RnfABCDGE type electron transport complex subunit G [Fusobacteriaceae bacterium]MBP6322921.1 RnfABCDGE type electron transport complex subunit G [Fusobacteriaceae bacterium]MBP9509861.1 RnfABCDGE type electron transport complex subunit G [Fusobacteriaceae bacterium]